MLTIKFFKSPHGEIKLIEADNIDKHTEDFFNQNNLLVSMEILNDTPIFYACEKDDFDEENEQIIISNGSNLNSNLRLLAIECSKSFNLPFSDE